MSKYLIVVDVQKIFTEKNLIDERRDFALNNIQQLANSKYFNRVVVTKCVNYIGSSFDRILGWSVCTLPAETNLSFVPPDNSLIVERATYGVNVGEIVDKLGANEEDEFYLVGFDTDACVYAVALNFFDANKNIRLVEDACYSSDGMASHTLGLNLFMRNIGMHNMYTTSEVI